MTEVVFATNSSSATEQLAEQIGQRLRGGEVIELISDLGGGKTTFVRGLARGFGSADRVTSPTFTLGKIYQAGSKQIAHFDFYRLSEPGLSSHELAEFIGDPTTVTVVEWGDIVQSILPPNHLTITIRRTGEEDRQLTLKYPSSQSYLTKDLK